MTTKSLFAHWQSMDYDYKQPICSPNLLCDHELPICPPDHLYDHERPISPLAIQGQQPQTAYLFLFPESSLELTAYLVHPTPGGL